MNCCSIHHNKIPFALGEGSRAPFGVGTPKSGADVDSQRFQSKVSFGTPQMSLKGRTEADVEASMFTIDANQIADENQGVRYDQ